MHATRRKGRTRSRILYWFRTPPGVRVGRAALDEDAIRLIEAGNPDVEFDWPRILKGGPPVAESAERRYEERHGPDRSVDRRAAASRRQKHDVPRQLPAAESPIEPPPSLTPLAASAGDEPASAAQRRLGAEGLVRLRGRHAAVLARIQERQADEQKRSELRELAERLNPDSWVTDADVTAGLDAYEPTFERLRGELGGRRKAVPPPELDASSAARDHEGEG